MQTDGFDDLVPDRMNRAERSHGLLWDQRDLAAPDLPHLGALGVQFRQVDGLGRAILGGAPEQHAAADDFARRLDDAEQRLHSHAFAAAALADDTEDLAGVDIQRDAVDRLHHPLIHEEVDLEISN